MENKRKRKPNNLILVSRPINFLYAIEVCQKYKARDFLVLIFPNATKQEVKAIEFLKSQFEKYMPNATFKKFPLIFRQGTANLILFNIYLKMGFAGRNYDLLSTSGGVKGRLVYKNLNFSHIEFTDEGSGSLKRFPEMFRTNRIWPKPKSKVFKKIYKGFGIDDLQKKTDFSIFTMYKELASISKKVEINSFTSLQRITAEMKFIQKEREVIILGSNPDAGGIPETKYLKTLKATAKEFTDFDVYYKPHKTYPKTYDFIPLKADLPIEYFILKRKFLPKYLLSFNSTSNQILSILFPEINIRNITID